MQTVIRIIHSIRGRIKLKMLLVGLALILAGVVASMTFSHLNSPRTLRMSTWSIVAADPVSGDVGVAMASCVPNVNADAIAALVPGKGAASIQAYWTLENRNQVFEMLKSGDSASAIIARMSDTDYDAQVGDRQYGIVTFNDGEVDIAAFTGQSNLDWAGSQRDSDFNVTVQGNILVSEEVVADALKAFTTSVTGFNTLPDRLMRALEAGSAAGGDSRCNYKNITQTAATTFILVARGGDDPYATENIDMTDMGEPSAPWLAISVAKPRFGPNPIEELRRRYDDWRVENSDPIDLPQVCSCLIR